MPMANHALLCYYLWQGARRGPRPLTSRFSGHLLELVLDLIGLGDALRVGLVSAGVASHLPPHGGDDGAGDGADPEDPVVGPHLVHVGNAVVVGVEAADYGGCEAASRVDGAAIDGEEDEVGEEVCEPDGQRGAVGVALDLHDSGDDEEGDQSLANKGVLVVKSAGDLVRASVGLNRGVVHHEEEES